MSSATTDQPTVVPILGKPSIIVHPGLFDSFIVKDLISNVKSSTYVLITDTNLAPLYVSDFQTKFDVAARATGTDVKLLVYDRVPPGENSKSRTTKAQVEDWMLAHGCTRDTVIIALGGGVMGDMIGYVAATYMRGVRFVQIPTTLLAMVDSSVGGKTAIDVPAGKNLVGAFWQPERIYIDLNFLDTLPKRQFINGMAEVVKTAAFRNIDEFAFLEDEADSIMACLDGDDEEGASTKESRFASISQTVKRIVLESVKVKAAVVSADEREGGLRNLLNFGHSIGHAYEAILAPQILHGECVAIGMVKEVELSRFLGHISPEAAARLTKCIASYGLPTSVEDKTVKKRSGNKVCHVTDLLRIMAVDKKNSGKQKKVVLLSGIGETLEQKASSVNDADIKVVLSPSVIVLPGISSSDVVCTPPGSKSISNRALILAALGKGTCRIKNLLHSDDTEVMLSAITKLGGASHSWEEKGSVLALSGNGGNLKASDQPLYLGNAGTASRFLTSIVAIAKSNDGPGSTVLTGNHRMKVRPIGPLVDALRANSVNVEYEEKEGSLPVRVKAGGLSGGLIELAATVSSQYVSSLLMAAPYANKAVTLKLVGGKPISQLYIDMTITMMASFGVQVEKSKTEENTYHIPKATYTNPPEYVIESDASSATYPLAIAAINGTKCTVPNIGSKSLQGDARFAIDVLAPMGCKVTQSEHSTTVQGPAKGKLRALPSIDMEPMTDAFLTASVLAAATSSGVTRISGIANQRVKECNRIAAMRTELAKFGVTTREFDDGIEVDGKGLLNLNQAKDGVHCYDDHRVAMSFSVLSTATANPTVIQDKACTGKTWPGWWDVMKGAFGATIEGADALTHEPEVTQASKMKNQSIFIIGMRGAGKTTSGRRAAQYLGWPFLDLDTALEQKLGKTIPELIRSEGWDVFRAEEANILADTMKTKATGHIIACGGGIIETDSARDLFASYMQTGGIVMLLTRNVQAIVDYLNIDKTRPAWSEDIFGVWLRRKPWYYECSNYQYHSQYTGQSASVNQDFCRFIDVITGRVSALEDVKKKPQSFFVCLTYPDLRPHLDQLPEITSGSDAIELRVDLLQDPSSDDGFCTSEYLIEQYSLLRAATCQPIIFTIRSESQGGRFPDSKLGRVFDLYRTAIRLGSDFVDLEITSPVKLLDAVSMKKGHSKIIASHHDPKGALSWNDGSWTPHFNKALQYGDVVKLVGSAKTYKDNRSLAEFRDSISATHSVPLIAINMGEVGKLSRIENPFMTPVWHPKLSFAAAPGQLSAAQIRQAKTLHGLIQPKKFYIVGSPVQQSRSPALHNALFGQNGLPHQYGRFETKKATAEFEDIIKAADFGGASVTIPMKQEVEPLLDGVSEDVQIIGALNTIVPVEDVVDGRPTVKLMGYNTDWLGMVMVLQKAGVSPGSGLVIGGGGTARAAIYALNALGISPIFLLGRNASKMRDMASSFPPKFKLEIVTPDNVESCKPTVALGTIPGDMPVEPGMLAALESIFTSSDRPGRSVLLEMAYKPADTPVKVLAEKCGWRTVNGLEVLVAQGVYQFKLWTGIDPHYDTARVRNAHAWSSYANNIQDAVLADN
jgi:pentafunctional AROM polypeptide